VASPLTLGYRNNSKLVAGRNAEGRLVLGGYAPRSHDVVDLDGCAVVEPVLAQVAAALRDVLEEARIEDYDERRLTGVLRYAMLRANADGQALVTLVTAHEAFPTGAAVAEQLRARAPAVAGVIHNINPTRGNVLFGDREQTLSGTPYLEDQIGAVRLRLSPRAFFQANRRVAALAYQEIASALTPGPADRVVDAYAGVGGIALTLAPSAGQVWGFEDHPAAAADAALSAGLNGVTNATFVAGDAADRLQALLDSERRVDLIVLNPPRRGCAPAVLQHAAALRPRRIAYLSCSPPTLLRDLASLSKLGYRTLQLTPFDMLPHTPHLEVLAALAAAR
jgi:23S rRNA (uracil1939-C5)-methyltransferase